MVFVPKLTKPVVGQPPSTEIRQKLLDEDRPVLVAFSGGKDSIATELALQEFGIETHLAYLYAIPGRKEGRPLSFIDDYLMRLEDMWQKPIACYPHVSLYRQLNAFLWQPPEHIEVIRDADLPEPEYAELWGYIREDFGLAADTWVADGVRASDSLVRRASIKNHGAMKLNNLKVSPIWDWLQGSVYGIMEHYNVPLSVDYEMFGRSFDGLDYRFLKPIKERFPDDFQVILDWFPLAEMEILRYETW